MKKIFTYLSVLLISLTFQQSVSYGATVSNSTNTINTEVTDLLTKNAVLYEKVGSLDVVHLSISRLVRDSLIDKSDDILISMAKYLFPKSTIKDAEDAKKKIIIGFTKFPYKPVTKELNYRLKDYGYSIFEYYVYPYLKKNATVFPTMSNYVSVMSDGGFTMVKKSNLYPFRQFGFSGTKCPGYVKGKMSGSGFIDGFITKNGQFYIIGAGCYENKPDKLQYNKKSLNGFIFNENIFTTKK